METLIVLFVVVFIATAIAYLVLAMLNRENKILNMVVMGSYTAFSLIGSFYNTANIAEGANTFILLEVFYMFVLSIISIIKKTKRMPLYVYGEAALLIAYMISYVCLKIGEETIMECVSEGLVYPICALYILEIILIVRKQEEKKHFGMVLMGTYLVLLIAFAFIPPFDGMSIIVSILFILIVGVIFAGIMFGIYKLTQKEKGGKQKEEVEEKTKEKGDFSE